MKRVTVAQRKLDDYASQITGRRTLIMIDVEGNELAVLQGSIKILQTIKPTIIFESFRDDARLPIYDFLESRCYSVHDLPYSPGDSTRPLSKVEFGNKGVTNCFLLYPSRVRVRRDLPDDLRLYAYREHTKRFRVQ